MPEQPSTNESVQPVPAAKPVASSAAKMARPVPPAVRSPRAAQAAAVRPARVEQAAPSNGQSAAAPEAAPSGSLQNRLHSMVTDWLRDSPSWLVSLVLHMVILMVLGLWMLPSEVKETFGLLSIHPTETEEEIEEIVETPIEELDIDVEHVTQVQPQVETNNVQQEAVVASANEVEAAAVAIELSDVGLETAPQNDLMKQVGAATGSGLDGRGKAARAALVAQGGGSPDSENAVKLALRWLAAHQLPDGGWSFNHRLGHYCQGRCPDPGSLEGARTAATAMAVLPFLGAGITHAEKGEYQQTVRGGLTYLVQSAKLSKEGANLIGGGGSMYAHGLASIVLCEAYGMTQDPQLMAPAQAALVYIITGQDKVTGGWGYGHGSGRDMSVAGWQIMALKSGHMAYLQIPPQTVQGVLHFLDGNQADGGAAYGYNGPGNGDATTAVGLLCRMYTGWKKDHEALQRGVERMAKSGPSLSNWYRDYYAAQVMFQATGAKGDVWKAWNDKLRDGLVASQSRQGHTEGSWFGPGGHSGSGGRLYCTSLATMMLEVYYRHMPIFREAATEDEFPIE